MNAHLPEIGEYSIAAIVPCYNEEKAVESVVSDLKRVVPGIDVYVYDNNSTDKTVEHALQAGAIVRTETAKGKGNVIRRAFADIEADIYVMIDGDDTYSVADLPKMITTLIEGPYDHVLGVRQQTTDTAYRAGHSWGNAMFNRLTSALFGRKVSDMLSGYRVFSRRMVKSFPALSQEFEIETELTVHYMSLRLPYAEVPIGFKDRPEGSESKLHTFKDGFKILSLLLKLLRFEKPVAFHSVLGGIVLLIALILGVPVVTEYLSTGLVPRLPTAVLSAVLVLISILIVSVGFVMDGLRRNRHESARLNYLTHRAVR